MNKCQLLNLESVYGIYCDAWVDDDDGLLVFASLWGRDTAIQELLAKLTLSTAEEGINQLHLSGDLSKTLRIGNPDRLDKLTGRMPKSNLFGDIVQLWLFDKTIKEPDYANKKAIMLIRPEHTDPINDFWQVIKMVSHLPLLDSWQHTITELVKENNWLKVHVGFAMNALSIQLPEQDLDEQISQLIRSGELVI